MRQTLFLFLIGLLITGCNNKGHNNEILSGPKMQAVLSDLMKADQFITDFRIPKDTAMDKDVESIKLYQQVFAIHGITKIQFEKSLSYYQSHPDLLQVIMDSISKPVVVAPVQPTVSKDTGLRKNSTFTAKDTSIQRKDTLPLPKKKIVRKNN